MRIWKIFKKSWCLYWVLKEFGFWRRRGKYINRLVFRIFVIYVGSIFWSVLM